MSEMTTEILEQNIGKIVLVRLKGGKAYAADSRALTSISTSS
jgi:small nuclear ribonucleoprotein (snRNP)-like protein